MAPPTTPPPTTTTTEPANPPDAVAAEILTLALQGDHSAIDFMDTSYLSDNSLRILANQIDFYAALPLADAVVSCETISENEDRAAVDCLVETTLLSEEAASVLGVALEGDTLISLVGGDVTRLSRPTLDGVFDSIAHHLALVDEASATPCAQTSPEVFATLWTVFDGACGTAVASHLGEYDEYLTTSDVSDPEIQYDISCQRCHGDEMTGVTGAGINLLGGIAVADSDEFFFGTITGGLDIMPAFPGFTDDQVNALIAMIRKAQEASGE